MKISDLAKLIDNKSAGSFFRIRYEVEAPVTAKYKETHPTPVYKVVEATVRTGIQYPHIGSVNLENRSTKKNNYHALIPNRIYYNTNTKQYYLYVFPTPNDNYKAEYSKDISLADLKSTSVKPIIKKIRVDHILEVK